MGIKVSASILSADFGCLGKEAKRVESAGADMIHIDVMDGHFVPNITIGPVVVKHIGPHTNLPLDVHLMVKEPLRFFDEFIKAGGDMITMHIEVASCAQIKYLRPQFKRKGVKLGVSLNPATPLSKIMPVIRAVDFVLVMSVNPGFSGQAFIPQVLPKIKKLRSVFSGDISVDGGINEKTAKEAILAGANILAAGSYIFEAENVKLAIERIRNAGKS